MSSGGRESTDKTRDKREKERKNRKDREKPYKATAVTPRLSILIPCGRAHYRNC